MSNWREQINKDNDDKTAMWVGTLAQWGGGAGMVWGATMALASNPVGWGVIGVGALFYAAGTAMKAAVIKHATWKANRDSGVRDKNGYVLDGSFLGSIPRALVPLP